MKEYFSRSRIISSVFVGLSSGCAGWGSQGGGEEGARPWVHNITFRGPASGGELIFYQIPAAGNARRSVAVKTAAGDSPAAVVRGLSDAMLASDAFGWRRGYRLGPLPYYADGDTFRGIPGGEDGMFIFAGDETGLGIPPPPHSLSVRYNAPRDRLLIHWLNPSSVTYDSIALMCDGGDRGRIVPGDKTECELPVDPPWPDRDLNNIHVSVVGYREGIPSNAASIRVMNNVEEEALGIPFTAGIAPNWVSWSSGADAVATASIVVQGTRPAGTKGKWFYQRFRSGKPGIVVGTWRQFLGLLPGHTYRISAWVCTGGMESAQGGWAFSIHAVPLTTSHGALSSQQMDGVAALPYGGRTAAEWQIARYGPEARTPGDEFALATTDPAKPIPGRTTSDITLPHDATAIAVWARYECSDTNARGVAFDHLRLEELPQP